MLLAILSRALVYGIQGSVQDLSYWTIYGRIDQFLIGMLLGIMFRQRPGVLSHPLWLLGFGALLLAAMQWFNNQGGFYGPGGLAGSTYPSLHALWVVLPTVEGLLWGGIVLSYANSRIRIPEMVDRGLAWLGRLSFSLYVMHNLVVFFILKQVGSLPFRPGHDVFNAVATGLFVVLPLTIAVAALTYYLIERPFLSLRGRYVSRPDAGLARGP